MIEFLPLIIAVILILALVFGRKWLLNRMDLNYNYRQQLIYDRACSIIFRKASETDTPHEDTMILLNAAAEVYNESLRGKYASELSAPLFKIVRQTSEMGKYTEGRMPGSQKEDEAEVIENDG
ncbi:hypothetical protein LCGC14_1175540 [marine sediment metagenome]|uniref:Uncharacterized protein n=1 Tax=marine sediment metagenome TaxID=412755 RepID=A0A0F9LNL6_9ZZZZ